MSNKNRRKELHDEKYLPAYQAVIPHYPLTVENLEGEIWLPIKDFPHYAISNFGRVKSFKAATPKILRPTLSADGYLKVNISTPDAKKVTTRVHILVAGMFIPNPANQPIVDHKDGNKLNNYVENLEWVTHETNSRRSVEHRRAIGILPPAPEPDIITVENVRGYLDRNGTAWLNAEDVARGLGFVDNQEKFSATSGGKPKRTPTCGRNEKKEEDFDTSGGKVIYEVIRWTRVNAHLESFGYKKVGKEDFIPENMFYRLAMKAKNEAAEKFQAKIADEILPTLRKTGKYELYPQNKKSSPDTWEVTREKVQYLLEAAKLTTDDILRDDLIRKLAFMID